MIVNARLYVHKPEETYSMWEFVCVCGCNAFCETFSGWIWLVVGLCLRDDNRPFIEVGEWTTTVGQSTIEDTTTRIRWSTGER